MLFIHCFPRQSVSVTVPERAGNSNRPINTHPFTAYLESGFQFQPNCSSVGRVMLRLRVKFWKSARRQTFDTELPAGVICLCQTTHLHAASTPPLRVLSLLKNKIGFSRGAEGKKIPREAERSLTTLILETRSLKIVLSKERRRRRRPQRTLEPKCSVSF